jgi:hypothetical protein
MADEKKRWRVTETQHIYYEWEVDADTEEEAIESANDGVPDAREHLVSSEVEAEEV